MKKTLLITSIALASTTAISPVSAGETATGLKQGAVFSSSAIVGAAAAGPLGFVVGAIGGAYLGEQIKKADTLAFTELALAEQKMQIAELQSELARADEKAGELSQLALDSLEFQVLFHTGADQLTERGEARVTALAEFLRKHPGLSVRLTGYADPRGTDEYNNVLSDYRARAVQTSLNSQGIEDYRVNRRAHGANKSTAARGDYEAYAMERRVDIEIFNPMVGDTLVQAH